MKAASNIITAVLVVALVGSGVLAIARPASANEPNPRQHREHRAPAPGGLTADQIRATIQRNIASVQRCYERGLARRSDMTGRVTIAFVIGPDGQVSGASVVENTLGDAAVANCIAGAVRSWRFPRPSPPGPVSVRFPFNLSQSRD